MFLADELIQLPSDMGLMRDKVAFFLKKNISNQKKMADQSDPKLVDSELYDARVYTELANPFEVWLGEDRYSIVDLTVETDDEVTYRRRKLTMKIDVFSVGRPHDDGSGGQVSGDFDAANKAQSMASLVQKLLESGAFEETFVYSSDEVNTAIPVVRSFTPRIIDPNNVPSMSMSVRLVELRVEFEYETSENNQTLPTQTMEGVNWKIVKATNGEVLAEGET